MAITQNKVFLVHHGGCNSFAPGCNCEPEQLTLENVKPLRSDQGARLAAARRCGYLVLSPCRNETNWTLQARWERYCHDKVWPCITVRRGASYGSVDLELPDPLTLDERQIGRICELITDMRKAGMAKRRATGTVGLGGCYLPGIKTAWCEHAARRVVGIAVEVMT